MRRSLAALALTVIALWLILSYKSSPLPNRSAALSATASSTTVPAPPGSGSEAAAGPPPGGPRGTTPTTAPQANRTVTGDDVPNQFGDVQVALVFNGSRIVDVKSLQLPFDRPRSKYISDQAAPYLRSEVLQAQSAQIDGVGGATYTSESYAESVQSALDKAQVRR